jgi:hypothetical protein
MGDLYIADVNKTLHKILDQLTRIANALEAGQRPPK